MTYKKSAGREEAVLCGDEEKTTICDPKKRKSDGGHIGFIPTRLSKVV